MQVKKNLNLIYILFLFIIVCVLMTTLDFLMTKSYATTYTYTASSNNLPSDFDSKYPGYRTLLQNLTAAHSNWTIQLNETNQTWDTVINSEYVGHGTSPKNLVPAGNSNYIGEWICNLDTCGPSNTYDTDYWCCASIPAIEYMMDPRNSINQSDVFQFLLLSRDSNITKNQVAAMASTISYLNSQTIIDAIWDVSNEENINPFFIIGKILQEQGSGASGLCSGNGYGGQYIGYYNLFNVGASGNSEAEVILNGLSYAQNKGWNTPKASLIGGIGLIKNYIQRGQNTLYYQKFNVVYAPYYANQYAQNVMDAQSIGSKLRGYYSNNNLLGSAFTFNIPLYTNMPSSACTRPSTSTPYTVQGESAYVNASGGLALRSSPAGSIIDYVGEGAKIIIMERASSKTGDYYWDKVSTPKGVGYMARESSDGSKVYLVILQTYKIEGSNILVTPNSSIASITGATNNSGTFGTGANISLSGNSYTLIMLGDVSGDGKISPADYVRVKNDIMKTSLLSDLNRKAADANRDGKISPADYVRIKNHIMKISSISI